jgi:hypothetical protein
LPLLIVRLKRHDAGGRVIGDSEAEATVGICSRLMPLVEAHRRLPRFAQSADDAQFAACNHRLVDNDIGHGGGRRGEDQWKPDQQALHHHAPLTIDGLASPNPGGYVN